MLTELSYLYDPLSLDVGLLHLLLGLSPHPEVQHWVAGSILQTPPLSRGLLLKIILHILATPLRFLHRLQRLGLNALPELQRPRSAVGSVNSGLSQPLVEVCVARLERDGVALDSRGVRPHHGHSSLGA